MTDETCDDCGGTGKQKAAQQQPEQSTMGERKTKLLCEQGAEPIGIALKKGDRIAVVTPEGRVEWFNQQPEQQAEPVGIPAARNSRDSYSEGWNACRAAMLSTVHPELAPGADERAAFENWMQANRYDVGTFASGEYHNMFARNAWMGWQARAAQSSQRA